MLKGRLEDDRMLTGRGRYVSDWNLPGQAYGFFLRSDRAHAKILSLKKDRALELPGVLAVFTGEDLRELKSLPCALPVKGRGGMELLNPGRPALAQGRVRFAGEPVALVVAESALAAQDGAELVEVDYEDLPVVARAKDAVMRGAPLVHDSVPGNIVMDYESGDESAAGQAFEKAARVVELDVDISRVIGNPMEPRACLAAFDAPSGCYHLYACTQGAAILRNQLSAVLGVPPEQIRVIAEEVGGGFGVRFNLYPEYCAALFAAKRLGRPVKWSGTRSEVFLADEQARDVRAKGALALDGEGKILGMRFDMLANLGAYLAPTGPFINTLGIVNCLSGVYDVPAAYARIRLALTHTAPMAAYRGAGRPVMSYALERLVEHAAHEIGMDPAELRRRNFIRRFPYKIAAGFEYDCGDFEGVMDKALAAADWRGFSDRRKHSSKNGRLRGHGMSTYIEATGAGFAPQDQIEMRWSEDASTLTLYAPTHSHGQGHETTFAQVVCRVLGIPLEAIRLRTAGSEFYITGNATGGSRSLLAVGSVLLLGAQELVKKGLDAAAEALEAAPADIEFVEGHYRIKGTDRRIALQKLAQERPGELDIAYANKFGSCFPNGCHIAEVEVDATSGETQIVSYVACDDAGNVVNPQIVEGQVHGGIAQGAGQALAELAVYDAESGQLLTGSFMDYAMPRPGDVQGLKLLEHAVPTTLNPLGAKGVGEAGVTGSLPAVMNAVLDALRAAGVQRFDMPASAHRVWQALEAVKPPQVVKPPQAAKR
ncbi:MAG TPA: xanthine dehydrogenase family protein molybdopterin-binding subunit [Burkholderiales bacterium]|nr:xanthine dehydrogenase family protein molybdopterin-binding subunit [Burkholderiales bacterium]